MDEVEEIEGVLQLAQQRSALRGVPAEVVQDRLPATDRDRVRAGRLEAGELVEVLGHHDIELGR